MSDLIDELTWRGLIKQHTDLDALRRALNEGPLTFYCGFDPTAASLHHGHLVQLIMMRHLQLAGHHPIALVGGATGLIGDPRMTSERQLQDKETVAGWADRLQHQIERFLDFEGDNPARMVNNLEWTAPLSAIDLLRDLGKNFRMGTMLSKDAVARRLKSEEGISFTEFSYQILQANDYLQLYRKYGVTLETGGNDQWGNLVGGMDLIRKVEGKDVHVMTTPLITKSDGTKFGKSEGGAIWLDPEMFSPYAFYQFWLNTEDADVVNLLKVFTFLSREEIEALETETQQNPGKRAAQRALAEAVTTLVHGADQTERVKAASTALFGRGDLREVDGKTLVAATADLPRTQAVLGETNILHLLVDSGLEKGIGAAKRTVASGGAYLNNEKVEDESRVVTAADVLPGGVVLFRKGKRQLGVAVTE
ncbi:tyrosine--tRNA ligase [Mobiluncus massiliensis]|uniref:tyrosine--tRNA ligase n=1 Tax=uncultured Mobiluncus sp. TaxID=293425 RepID=UPI0024AD5CAB|nr:tyrosine--tRNA ligase [Mobiluncus sp. Marseille-Q7826]